MSMTARVLLRHVRDSYKMPDMYSEGLFKNLLEALAGKLISGDYNV